MNHFPLKALLSNMTLKTMSINSVLRSRRDESETEQKSMDFSEIPQVCPIN